MMKLALNQERLINGTKMEKPGTLLLPAEGGGFVIPEMASSGERYLNFTLCVEEDHSMAFELRGYNRLMEKKVTVRFGVMPRFRTNISLDLNWLDGHILYPGHLPGELKTVCHGSRIERNEIGKAEIVSIPCFHETSVQLENMELSEQPLTADLPSDKPLIDAIGQYIPKEWEGKTHSIEEMVERMRDERASEEKWAHAGRTQWGGFRNLKISEPTGFFHTVRTPERWMVADPEGFAFFSLGADCVAARCDARVDGMEMLAEQLPDINDPSFEEVWKNADKPYGEENRVAKLFSYERANLQRAFGKDWRNAWKDISIRLMKQFGMNTLGNWSDHELYGLMPYVTMLERFPETKHTIFRDFPDVLSPEYAADAVACAASLKEKNMDPSMIGYFMRNEPGWAFVDGLVIADEVLRDPEETYCKRGLISFLKEKYADIHQLNEAWKTDFADFTDLTHPIAQASKLSEKAESDLREYSGTLIEAYVSIPARECRKADPNHMNLGMRWAWISDPALVSGWKYFDVFSINCYAVDPTDAIRHVRELGVELPVMIGEFHFGALDAGNTATGLEGTLNQQEKGKAFQYYVERTASDPYGVGCHWFQFSDQAALGRFDGENYNIGLVDVTLKPHHCMLEAARKTGERLSGIMTGAIRPTEEKPVTIPMIAY